MPRVIDLADERRASLAEACDALAAAGFDPDCDESLHTPRAGCGGWATTMSSWATC